MSFATRLVERSLAIACTLAIAACATTSTEKSNMPSNTQASPLSTAEMISFVATTDGESCRQFYEKKLGFKVLLDDARFLIFEIDGRRIRVQKLPEFTPQKFTILGWDVRDIDATVAKLASAGVKCELFPGAKQNERGIMDFPDGTRVAWFKDPDGNILSVAQMPH